MFNSVDSVLIFSQTALKSSHVNVWDVKNQSVDVKDWWKRNKAMFQMTSQVLKNLKVLFFPQNNSKAISKINLSWLQKVWGEFLNHIRSLNLAATKYPESWIFITSLKHWKIKRLYAFELFASLFTVLWRWESFDPKIELHWNSSRKKSAKHKKAIRNQKKSALVSSISEKKFIFSDLFKRFSSNVQRWSSLIIYDSESTSAKLLLDFNQGCVWCVCFSCVHFQAMDDVAMENLKIVSWVPTSGLICLYF